MNRRDVLKIVPVAAATVLFYINDGAWETSAEIRKSSSLGFNLQAAASAGPLRVRNVGRTLLSANARSGN